MNKIPETKLTLRIPPDLADVIRILAQVHDRSLNSEIVHVLRDYAASHVQEWSDLKKREPRND